MADELDAKTTEKMRTLCGTISVAHDLDPEIQEELYGHMEDKLLAYLNGEEPMTEADAFILVREHFGDPRALKGLLRDVHAPEADLSLMRRLAAVAVASTALAIARNVLRAAVWTPLAVLLSLNGATELGAAVFVAFGELTALAAPVLTWVILLDWQRRLNAGRSAWFLEWRPGRLLALIATLLLLAALGPSPNVFPTGLHTSITDLTRALPWVRWFPMGPSAILQCLVWLWWCDRPPRRVLTLVRGAGAWLVFVMTATVLGMYLHVGFGTADTAAGISLPEQFSRFHAGGDLWGTSLRWTLHFLPKADPMVWYTYLLFLRPSLFVHGVSGLSACLLYQSTHYLRHKAAVRRLRNTA